jgi:hypothetical protein
MLGAEPITARNGAATEGRPYRAFSAEWFLRRLPNGQKAVGQ